MFVLEHLGAKKQRPNAFITRPGRYIKKVEEKGGKNSIPLGGRDSAMVDSHDPKTKQFDEYQTNEYQRLSVTRHFIKKTNTILTIGARNSIPGVWRSPIGVVLCAESVLRSKILKPFILRRTCRGIRNIIYSVFFLCMVGVPAIVLFF